MKEIYSSNYKNNSILFLVPKSFVKGVEEKCFGVGFFCIYFVKS